MTDQEQSFLTFLEGQFRRSRIHTWCAAIIVGLTVLGLAAIGGSLLHWYAVRLIESNRCQCRLMRVEASGGHSVVSLSGDSVAESIARDILKHKKELPDGDLRRTDSTTGPVKR